MSVIRGVGRGQGRARSLRSSANRSSLILLLLFAPIFAALGAPTRAPAEPVEYGAIVFPGEEPTRAGKQIAILPFRLNSEGALGFLTESLDELLAQRIEAGGEVGAVERPNCPT